MSHELELDANGNASLFLADAPAWHGLGTILKGNIKSREAAITSRGNYIVAKKPARTEEGKIIDGWYYTYRTDTGRPLGMVSERYNIIQNHECFEFLDSLVDNGEMFYESAGVLNDGERFWALARMPEVDEMAEGDKSLRYVLFYHGHDGLTPVVPTPTATRVVCANTVAIACSSAKLSFRHRGDVTQKLEYAKQYISQFNSGFTLFRDNGRLLASRKISAADSKEYIKKLFPMPEEAGRGQTMMEKRIMAVMQALLLPRNQLPSIRGTWWQMFNAITDSVDHNELKKIDTDARREKRFADLMTGSSADFKTDALKLALDMSA